MKNIRLIALVFNAALAVITQSGGGQNVAWAEQNQMLFKVSKTEFTATGDVKLPFLELKASVRNDGSEQTDCNYGISFSTKPFTPLFPVTVKAGLLSAGGSLSRLNSPELSKSISAFGSTSVRLKELEASLPSESSFTKPPSVFVQAAAGTKKLNFGVSSFYDGETVTADATFKLEPFKALEISANLTGGFFPYKQNSRNTWFNEQGFYHQGGHICANGEFFVKIGGFSSVFTLGLYESPQGKYEKTYRSENIIKFTNFSFHFNSFYNRFDAIITSSGKTLSPLLQLEAGGQYKYKTQGKNPATVTTGFNSQLQINLNSDEHNAVAAGGFKVNGRFLSGSLTANADIGLKQQMDGIKVDFEGAGLKGALGFSIKDFRTQVSASASVTPAEKKESFYFSEKLGITFNYTNFVELSSSNTLSLSQKKEKKYSFSSSLSAKAQFRFCSLRVRLEFQV